MGEELFQQRQKIVKNKRTKGIHIGSCIFLYFHDYLHFRPPLKLIVEKIWKNYQAPSKVLENKT